MHPSVIAWVCEVLTQADVAGRTVLEVGSFNVNGTVRPLVVANGPASYVGVDATAGPGVDRVVDAADLARTFGAGSFDVVVSTEMLEHAARWRGALWAMTRVLGPGGLLLLSTRSPGFPYHGFPDDHWRFPVLLMGQILSALGFAVDDLRPDPDPQSPGVFAKARKATPWRPDVAAFEMLDAEPAPRR